VGDTCGDIAPFRQVKRPALNEGTMGKTEDLLTAGKVAKALEVKPAEVKKAITELGLEPDVVKGGCSYYNPDSVMKIKKKLG
jgi:hypothetical protein